MPTVNFYLKNPVVYTCISHPGVLQWLPGKCSVCGKSLAIRKGIGEKHPAGAPPPCLIYLQMRYRGEKFVYSVGENVAPRDWDKSKQQVKVRSKTSKDGKDNLNSLLSKLKEICLKTYNATISNGIPTKQDLRAPLDEYMNRHLQRGREVAGMPSFFSLIDRLISGDVGEAKTAGTISNYRSAKKYLEGFQKDTSFMVNFDTIGLEFKYKYVKWLAKDKIKTRTGKKNKGDKVTAKGLSQNSIAKEIRNIKTFMNMAVELGYTTNLDFKKKKFGLREAGSDAVYLTDSELRKLYEYDFSGNKRLEPVRDLFVFSSYVGLRYSDASAIKPENIITMDGKQFIKLVTKKTKTPVIIPCNDIVLSIFKKYENNPNRLPHSKKLQNYNIDIKEICRIAGLTETGRLTSDLDRPLFTCVSSHTARRNFATNYYLMGMDNRMIMAVTGHTTEKSFLNYIKVTREENAKRMNEYMMKDLSKKSLKVAG